MLCRSVTKGVRLRTFFEDRFFTSRRHEETKGVGLVVVVVVVVVIIIIVVSHSRWSSSSSSSSSSSYTSRGVCVRDFILRTLSERKKRSNSFFFFFGFQLKTSLDIFFATFLPLPRRHNNRSRTPYHKLRPLGLVCVSRVKRLVKKKKKKKKEKETDLRERRETTTTRKKRRGEERLRRLGF